MFISDKFEVVRVIVFYILKFSCTQFTWIEKRLLFWGGRIILKKWVYNQSQFLLFPRRIWSVWPNLFLVTGTWHRLWSIQKKYPKLGNKTKDSTPCPFKFIQGHCLTCLPMRFLNLGQWFSKCNPSTPGSPQQTSGILGRSSLSNYITVWAWIFFMAFNQTTSHIRLNAENKYEKPTFTKLGLETCENVKQRYPFH